MSDKQREKKGRGKEIQKKREREKERKRERNKEDRAHGIPRSAYMYPDPKDSPLCEWRGQGCICYAFHTQLPPLVCMFVVMCEYYVIHQCK